MSAIRGPGLKQDIWTAIKIGFPVGFLVWLATLGLLQVCK